MSSTRTAAPARTPWRRRLAAAGLALTSAAGTLALNVAAAPSANAAGAQLLGAGSTYVALAMNQWVADGKRLGLDLTYTANGSPGGLSLFDARQIDFAGTEAEVSALQGGSETGFGRSFQYTPDVAGATAIMYNVKDSAGRKVDYLHLSRRTVAEIFLGRITRWNDPKIRAENLNTKFQEKPIRVVYRSGESGTTSLFYDFVKASAPDLWPAFVARQGLSLRGNQRVISIPRGYPDGVGLPSSDQIAQYVASDSTGDGSIGYDEFGYAKSFGVNAAWIQNQAGKWVLPYATNISAALTRARLRADLSQELSGVYVNPDPLAYPISAYSYLMTPCAPTAQRRSCKTPFYTAAQAETMAKWMDYIACDGQVKMAQLGYSPLPPNLSQEIQNSIARLGSGARARSLNASNCRNPRFRGSLGAGSVSPPDPFARIDPRRYDGGGTATGRPGGTAAGAGDGGGGSGAGGASATGSGSGAGSGSAGGGPPGSGPAGRAGGGATSRAPGATPPTGRATAQPGLVGRAGATEQAGGGSTEYRDAEPVSYGGVDTPAAGSGPLVALLLLVTVPPVVIAVVAQRRRRG